MALPGPRLGKQLSRLSSNQINRSVITEFTQQHIQNTNLTALRVWGCLGVWGRRENVTAKCSQGTGILASLAHQLHSERSGRWV